MIDSNHVLKSCYRQFEVNVGVPLKLAVEVARKFWRYRDRENAEMNRNVINVSSIAGMNIYPDSGQSVYSASKAALNHLTYHMAHEFHDFRVRVNATAPDSFPAIVPIERMAETILRLDKGDMTGKILVLDREGDRLIGTPSVHSR
jgi:NAD(P)-dependent dehydrogenase (short-subunit alcohol dehydrogenase family)